MRLGLTGLNLAIWENDSAIPSNGLAGRCLLTIVHREAPKD